MKRFVISLTILLMAVVLFNCTPTKSIQKNLNSECSTLAYLKDSDFSGNLKETGISVDKVSFNVTDFPDETQVIKQKSWFIPLVLVYIWNSKNLCTLGKSVIAENIPDFLEQSFIEESDRSGIYYILDSEDSEYHLEISIDEIKTEGEYKSGGFFYFAVYVYGYYYSDIAGPALSTLGVSYKLRKDDQVILSNTITAETITKQIPVHVNNVKQLQKDYAVSMVEASSANFKKVIEKIVSEINDYFKS